MRKTFWLVMLIGMLTGCGSLSNISVNDLRSDSNLRAEGVLDLSIPQIQEALYKYGNACRALGPLSVDPKNIKKAHYVVYMPGLTKSSAAMLIDFQQKDEFHTAYRGYTYYGTWSSRVDEVISAIRSPEKCIN